MNILKTYTGDDAVKIAAILYEINQIAKNFKNNNSYTMYAGKVYAYKESSEDLVHQVLSYSTLTNRNKSCYNGDIQTFTYYITNGKEFYTWYNEYKKNIFNIKVYDTHFKISTTNDSIYYETPSMVAMEKNDYIDMKKYFSRISISNKTLLYSKDNYNEIRKVDLSNLILPYTVKFPISDNRELKYKFTKKVLPNYKSKTSNINIFIYSVDEDNNIYEVVYDITDKNSIITNYATVVHY